MVAADADELARGAQADGEVEGGGVVGGEVGVEPGLGFREGGVRAGLGRPWIVRVSLLRFFGLEWRGIHFITSGWVRRTWKASTSSGTKGRMSRRSVVMCGRAESGG